MSIATDVPRTTDPAIGDAEGFFEVVDGQIVEQPPMGTESVYITNRIAFELSAVVNPGRAGLVMSEMLFTLKALPPAPPPARRRLRLRRAMAARPPDPSG